MWVFAKGVWFKLPQLTEQQEQYLRALVDRITSFREFGGDDLIEPCKRIIRRAKDKGWPSNPIKNQIPGLEYPTHLLPIHVDWMLHHGVQMPDPKLLVMAHGCANVKPQKTGKKGPNLCFQGSHGHLRSQIVNTEHTECQNCIVGFVQTFRLDPSVPTSGVITVATVRKYDPKCTRRCIHRPRCLCNFN